MLDTEADTKYEGWKFDIDEENGSGDEDRKDVDIDTKDDHSTPVSFIPLVLFDRLLKTGQF